MHVGGSGDRKYRLQKGFDCSSLLATFFSSWTQVKDVELKVV